MRSPYNMKFKGKRKTMAGKGVKPRGSHSKKPDKAELIKAGLAVFTALIIFSYVLFPDSFSSIHISFFGKATAANKKSGEKTSMKKVEDGKKEPGTESQRSPDQTIDRTPDYAKDISYFSKLEEKEKILNAREQGLVELEADLQEQKKQIELKISELKQLREKVSTLLKDRVETDKEKLMKLVEFYSNMKPQKAAQIMNNIDENLAVEILNKMKKKNAAAILNLVSPDKAQSLSEKFAGYQQ